MLAIVEGLTSSCSLFTAQYQEFIIDELRNSIESLMTSQAAVIKEHEEQKKLKEQQRQLLHPHVKPDDSRHQYHNNHGTPTPMKDRHEDESELIKLGRSWAAQEGNSDADKVINAQIWYEVVV